VIANQKGFTLIELVLTIVLISVLFVFLGITVFQYIEGTIRAQDYSQALNIVQLDMERIKNLNYDSVATVYFPNYLGLRYDIYREVVFVQGTAATAESLKQVRVYVRRTGTTPVLFNFVTYLARNINYGL
jgi:prepilin-type N-terminal cleavage/methylation domain-containing protein